MKIKYNQFLKGCIAFIITVACLYIVQAIWLSNAVHLPLDKALNDIDGVIAVTLDDNNKISDNATIYVTLDDTSNIQKTYIEISTKIEQTLKSSEYTLEIKDNRSTELEEMYYDIHYYIQKAMVDGDFPLLDAKVREKADLAGAAAKVYVDEEHIYLQISKSDHTLYSVVSRQSSKVGGKL
jgi:DNA-directed RNA polymerase subunit L